jgi:hypothetical protein
MGVHITKHEMVCVCTEVIIRVAIEIPFRKFRRIDWECFAFHYSAEKSVPFAEFCVSWNSQFQSSERQGTERNSAKKCFLKVIQVFECERASFYEMVWNNSELLYLPRNGSERNSKSFQFREIDGIPSK